jgi:hypothetical protein
VTIHEQAAPIREPTRIEEPVTPPPRTEGASATAPIPPAVEQAQDALEHETPEDQKAATP